MDAAERRNVRHLAPARCTHACYAAARSGALSGPVRFCVQRPAGAGLCHDSRPCTALVCTMCGAAASSSGACAHGDLTISAGPGGVIGSYRACAPPSVTNFQRSHAHRHTINPTTYVRRVRVESRERATVRGEGNRAPLPAFVASESMWAPTTARLWPENLILARASRVALIWSCCEVPVETTCPVL